MPHLQEGAHGAGHLLGAFLTLDDETAAAKPGALEDEFGALVGDMRF
jgi:hypothetical protein